jgi:hypothetical protein
MIAALDAREIGSVGRAFRVGLLGHRRVEGPRGVRERSEQTTTATQRPGFPADDSLVPPRHRGPARTEGEVMARYLQQTQVEDPQWLP